MSSLAASAVMLRKFPRAFLISAAALMALAGWSAIAPGSSFAQPKPANKPAGKNDAKSDPTFPVGNFTIHASYWKSTKGKDAPVVILLHQDGGKRQDWNVFAERLNNEGYAVVSVDLRHHGESRESKEGESTSTTSTASSGSSSKKPATVSLKPNDYAAMVAGDLEAVKEFLVEEHEKKALNVRKTAIIAAGMSAPIAINFAANDWAKKPYDDAPTIDARTPKGQDIRALMLLSPEENLPGVPSNKALGFLRTEEFNLAVFVGCGVKDKKDRGNSKKIFDQLAAGKKDTERMFFEKYDNVSVRGTDMLNKNTKLEAHMLGFLKKYLMDLNEASDEWRSRKPFGGR